MGRATLRPNRSSQRVAASSRETPPVHSLASRIRHVLAVFKFIVLRPRFVQSSVPSGRTACPGHANVRYRDRTYGSASRDPTNESQRRQPDKRYERRELQWDAKRRTRHTRLELRRRICRRDFACGQRSRVRASVRTEKGERRPVDVARAAVATIRAFSADGKVRALPTVVACPHHRRVQA